MPQEQKRRPGPPKTNRPTIADVARIAGVSTATVSRALRNAAAVSSSTQLKIRAAARSTGYEANASPRVRGTHVLALIPRLGSPFFTPFLDAVTDLISEAGYCITVGDLNGSRRKEEHYARALRDGSFAGAILFTGRVPAIGIAEADARPPLVAMVLACNEIDGACGLPVFDVANRKAAQEMVTYLLGLGHRRIAHIRGPTVNAGPTRDFADIKMLLRPPGCELRKISFGKETSTSVVAQRSPVGSWPARIARQRSFQPTIRWRWVSLQRLRRPASWFRGMSQSLGSTILNTPRYLIHP
jgi:DNA-binding LacI/PurR family transcriptional regulator